MPRMFSSLKFGAQVISLADARKLRDILGALGFERPAIETPDGAVEEEFEERGIEPTDVLPFSFRFGYTTDVHNVALMANGFRNGLRPGILVNLGTLRPGMHPAQWLLEVPGVSEFIDRTLEAKIAAVAS